MATREGILKSLLRPSILYARAETNKRVWMRTSNFQGGHGRRFPPRSSGFPPAGPSLRLRHCCCEWTAGGCSSPGKTALSRCSHCVDTQHGSLRAEHSRRWHTDNNGDELLGEMGLSRRVGRAGNDDDMCSYERC